MDIIEAGNPDAFQEYMSEYENTICGRHPIGVFLHVSNDPINFFLCFLSFSFCSLPNVMKLATVLSLQMLKHCATRMRIKFLQYEQSSQCKSMRDSSVSYASAVVTALQ